MLHIIVSYSQKFEFVMHIHPIEGECSVGSLASQAGF